MAKCPNCGRKLHIYDWKPECPQCGTNLNYYNSNKNLLEESERAEKEHALFQPKIDRAKAAYAGSKLAIIRIVLSLLPVGALFLPLFKSHDGIASANVLRAYELMNSAGIGNVLGGAFGNGMYLSASLLLISAAMIIVSLVLIIMSLGKHGKLRVLITYGFMFTCSLGSLIAFSVCAKAPSVRLFEGEGAIAPVKTGIGAYLYVFLMLVLFVYNIILIKKGIPVKYTPCLIGGLPGEEYFRYVEQGMSQSELNRKMLVALSELDEKRRLELKEKGVEEQ